MHHVIQKLRFVRHALEASGGFAPQITRKDVVITQQTDAGPITGVRSMPVLASHCYIEPNAREDLDKYAYRVSVTTYINYLLSAVTRFVGFLQRRKPIRQGTENPLIDIFIQDADMRGNSLDGFLYGFAHAAKAFGCGLVLLDSSIGEDAPESLDAQIRGRIVPYLRAIDPDIVKDISIVSETGRIRRIEIYATEEIDGKETEVTRWWDDVQWCVEKGGVVLRSGPHGFKACPIIPFTENGRTWPQLGNYVQIADLGKESYQQRSQLNVILSHATFPLLTYPVPDTVMQGDVSKAVMTIGLNSVLPFTGTTAPAYISPDQGDVKTHSDNLKAISAEIARITHDEATQSPGGVESADAKRQRAEGLNTELANFASRMQGLERKIWELFTGFLGISNSIKVEWPTDFNLINTDAELTILQRMRDNQFPQSAILAKMKYIAGAEFDGLPDDVKAAIAADIDQIERELANARVTG